MPTTDFSGIPTYRDRAIARDLQAFARGDIRFPYSRAGDIPGAPALSEDPALRRFVCDVGASDVDRIAGTDTDEILARLPDWRERGRALLARDAALVIDYEAARAGDEAARDRLRAPIAEGGYGEPDLARASAWDHAADVSDMTVAEASDALESYAAVLAEESYARALAEDVDVDYEARDLAELHACSDYAEVRDYEEGDKPGRY